MTTAIFNNDGCDTLTTEYTKTNTPKDLFASKEHYMSFVQAWKKYANSPEGKNLDSYHFALYLMFRGKDWRKAFTPITNPKKADSQKHTYFGAYEAFRKLRYAIKYNSDSLIAMFDNTITKEMLTMLLDYLPTEQDFRGNGSAYYTRLPEMPYKG